MERHSTNLLSVGESEEGSLFGVLDVDVTEGVVLKVSDQDLVSTLAVDSEAADSQAIIAAGFSDDEVIHMVRGR